MFQVVKICVLSIKNIISKFVLRTNSSIGALCV